MFNSAVASGASESSAFAQANGTANKGIVQCSQFGEDGHVCSAKCGPDDMPDSLAPVMPLGGATTFDEADSFSAAAELAEDAGDLWGTFTALLDNIRSNPDMTGADKATAVKQAADDYGTRLQQLDLAGDGGKSWVDRIKGALGRLTLPRKERAKELGASLSSFTVTKDLHGADRWVALVSNRFYDREGEVFPEAAHLEYVSYVDASKEFPELWLWHTPGSRIGEADMVEYADGFLIASGTFDADAGGAAAALRAQRKELGVSHGFGYRAENLTDDGAYTQYRTFEISPLPRDKAANPWTAFGIEEVQLMSLTKEKRAFLASVLGEEPVSRIESELPAFAKALQERGVQFKDVLDVVDQEESAPEGNGNGGDEPEGEPPPEGDAPEGGEEPEGDGSRDEPESVGAGTLAQISSALTSLATSIPRIETSVAELSTRVKELERSDDEKLTAKMSPRRPAPTDADQRPSADDGNVIPDDLAKKIFGDEKEKDPALAGSSARAYAQDLLNGANRIPKDQ